MRALLTGALCALLMAAGLGPAEAAGSRMAIVVGNDLGAQPRKALRYAQRDASRVAELLVELGGFEAEDVAVLTGNSAAALRSAFSEVQHKLRARAQQNAERTLLMVYFSGHADGVHLELGDEHLPFAELREMLEDSAAYVTVALVDACHSGHLAAKGVTPGASFDLTVSDSLDTQGVALITSSSGEEVSQESGLLRGSYFTHYLLSGLRGAADYDGNQKVTLSEVYRFAYGRTVVETARTLRGAQHPSYDYRLTGRGDVVLTDLSTPTSRLVFGPEAEGNFLVIDRPRGDLVAEVSKGAGSWRRLSVAAGRYTVVHQRKDAVYSSELGVAEEAELRVDPTQMVEDTTTLVGLKGGAPRHQWQAMAHYVLNSGVLHSFGAVHQAAVGLRRDLGKVTLMTRFSYGEARVNDGGLLFFVRALGLEASAARRFELASLDLFAGANGGLSWETQRLRNERERRGMTYHLTALGGLSVPLHPHFELQTFWEAGGRFFQLDSEVTARPLLRFSAGVAVPF